MLEPQCKHLAKSGALKLMYPGVKHDDEVPSSCASLICNFRAQSKFTTHIPETTIEALLSRKRDKTTGK